jgi:hypothetical protein
MRSFVAKNALYILGLPHEKLSLSEALEGVASYSANLASDVASTSNTVLQQRHLRRSARLYLKCLYETYKRFQTGSQDCSQSATPLLPYQYGNLHTSKPIIRLLQINPGTAVDPLICRLREVDLSSKHPRYEAVSYAWGDGIRETPIICDAKVLKITESLYGALCRIRLSTVPRYVWVDAICINQDNGEERSHQVSLMLKIYQKATQTLVWLGEDSERDAFCAFSLICVLVNTHSRSSPVAEFINRGETVLPSGEELLLMSSWIKLFDSLANMYMRPWFWRLWVVQEIVVAKSATIMWGQAEISWRWLGWASEWLRTNEHHLLRYFGISGIYNAYLMEYLSRREDISSFSLVRLLGLTRQFGATDPRDRIFALLGIFSSDNGSLLLQPDYQLSASQLYEKFARLILSRDKDLRILSAVQHGTTIEESLPSWVPRWDNVYCHGLAPSEPGPNHRATDGIQMLEIKTENASDLVLKGIAFDRIAKSAEMIAPQSFQELQRRSPGVFAFTLATYDFWGDYEDESQAKTLAWTLTAGKDWYGMLINDAESSTHWADFAAYWTEFSRPRVLDHSPDFKYSKVYRKYYKIKQEWNGDVDRFLEAASNACVGRRLFVTESGRLGLGPGALKVGDRCCVLFGGIVPFVLRQRDNARHLLVGECYVRDVMQGEIVQKWRDGSVSTEDFCIC